MPTTETAPSAGTAAHAHEAHDAAHHDAHVRLWRAAWYVALRSGLDARGSMPPVEPWARDDGREMPLGFARPRWRSGMTAWDELAGEWWVAYVPCLVREVDRDLPHVAHDVERETRPPRAVPTTGSQGCGVLHPYAPDDAVVRGGRDTLGVVCWVFWEGDVPCHCECEVAYSNARSDSPATPASIPHTRDDGRVEWGDDPATVPLLDGMGAITWHQYAQPPRGLQRARLLGGTAAGDPPSPWWEGDGRDGNSLTWRVPSVP